MRRPVRPYSTFWECETEKLAYERAVREVQPQRRWTAPRGDSGPRDGQETWISMGVLLEEIAQLGDGFYRGAAV